MPSSSHTLFEQHLAAGKARRQNCSRSLHADVSLAPQRDILAMIESTSEGRVPGLVPLRYSRMSVSPFTFFRGMAMIQAADLAAGPQTGLDIQICGDAHLMNYGFFASPERNLIFDINDFDETHVAPWEWDVKRLSVSLVLASRNLGLPDTVARDIAQTAINVYRRRMFDFSQMAQLDIWYTRITHNQLLEMAPDQAIHQQLLKLGEKARNQTQERLLPKLTDTQDNQLRLKDNPPVLFHLDDPSVLQPNDDIWLAPGNWAGIIRRMSDAYASTLKEDRRELIRRFRLVDVAFKVVGVGSVGTRCLVALLQDDYDQPLFLQLKEARPSVLENFTNTCPHGHQGKRVVFGQRLMQAASDLFLGWCKGPGNRDFYVRQLRDMKAAPALTEFDKGSLTAFGQACAWALARAHAKSSGKAAEIAGYMGQSERFEQAVANYSVSYADQVEKDYEQFMGAIRQGRFPTVTDDDLQSTYHLDTKGDSVI